jgi:hypothetical protein
MPAVPEAAIDRYNDAIEKACEAGTFADAADWQFAIRLIQVSYGVGTLADLNEPYRLAQASRAAGDDSVLPSLSPALDLALSDLLDSRLPDALAALRRYRRHAVALADWRAEREAGTRLGDVHAAAGEPSAAIGYYIACGENAQISISITQSFSQHSHGGYAAEADAQTGRLPASDAPDSGHVLPGGRNGCRRRSKRLIRWALPSGRASGEARGLRGDGGSTHRMLTCPGKLGRGRPQRGRVPGPGGISRRRVRSRRYEGCVRPGTAHGRPGQRRAAAKGITGTAPGNSGCVPLRASPMPG